MRFKHACLLAIALTGISVLAGCSDAKMRQRVAALDTKTLEELSSQYPPGSKEARAISDELSKRKPSPPVKPSAPKQPATPPKSVSTRTPPAKPSPPPPPSRKPADPQKVLREGIPNTKTSYDKFKGWTWVKPVQETDVEINANVELGFQPYIGVSDQKTVLFRIYTHYIDRRSEYHDTDWIFYESIILLNADRQKLTFTLDYGDRDSDVEDWGLMEYADIHLQPARVEELSTFIKAQPIDIRFAGKSVVDGKLNSANVDAINDMIAAWRMLTATE